jgi:hypothetical protein
MIVFFFLIGFLLFFLNNNKWENNVKLLLIFFPFFGLIANNLKPYSNLSSIFYDFVLIIPIYLAIITKKFNTEHPIILNTNLKFSLVFFILVIIAQFLNPFNSIGLLSKLVGLKVWIFYFLMIAVGFHYIQSKNDVIIICKNLSKLASIPCVIAILQFILSFRIGYSETMNLFYPPEIARAATQNFQTFSIASNIELRRIPSTFTSAAQFSNFLLFSFIPVLTTLNYSKNKKDKFIYTSIFFLIIFSSIASGVRGMYIYIPIFFVYYAVIKKRIDNLIFYGFVSSVVLFTLYSLKLANLEYLLLDIKRLLILYGSNTLKGGFGYLLENFFGNGLGTATFQTYFITGESVQVGPELNESHFFKVITELGFIGLIAIVIFYISIITTLFNCLNFEKNDTFKTFISSFIAFYLVMLTINFKSMHIDLFPSNFLIFLFLGIILKLNKIEN